MHELQQKLASLFKATTAETSLEPLQGGQVKLLCDWDSYRIKLLNEHLACTATRFSTERPLIGELRPDKLNCFPLLGNFETPENLHLQEFVGAAESDGLKTFPVRVAIATLHTTCSE